VIGEIYNPRTEPTAAEWELAYQLLRPFPFTCSPVRHSARAVVSYREGILELLESLQAKWIELGKLDAEFAVRQRAELFALDLQEAIDVVRGNVAGRAVRLAVKQGDRT
jgi:hypothetical protein